MTDSDEVKLLPCALADELEEIRRGVDAFNPDARLAARSAFDAAEQVWKKVPEIIAALRTRPPVVTDKVVERVVFACRQSLQIRMPLHVSRERVDEVARDVGIAALNAAIASMPAVVSGGQSATVSGEHGVSAPVRRPRG